MYIKKPIGTNRQATLKNLKFNQFKSGQSLLISTARKCVNVSIYNAKVVGYSQLWLKIIQATYKRNIINAARHPAREKSFWSSRLPCAMLDKNYKIRAVSLVHALRFLSAIRAGIFNGLLLIFRLLFSRVLFGFVEV
jgi:hypothetical protein